MEFLICFVFYFFINEPNIKIDPDERVLLNRAAEAKKKYIAEGTDASIADQLVFKEILVPNSKLFIHEFWFDIVGWIAAPEDDPLTERHKDNPWLWEFMPPRDAGVAESAPSRKFQEARSMFDLDPNGFTEALRAFYKDVCIQDACDLLIKGFVTNKDGSLNCWIELQNHISAILKNTAATPGDDPVTTDDPLQKVQSLLSSYVEKMDTVHKGLDDTAKLLRRYLTITKPYENARFSKDNLWRFANLTQRSHKQPGL
jgi:hypothetical protein